MDLTSAAFLLPLFFKDGEREDLSMATIFPLSPTLSQVGFYFLHGIAYVSLPQFTRPVYFVVLLTLLVLVP